MRPGAALPPHRQFFLPGDCYGGALTATARYPGTRGNSITIVVTALPDEEDSFQVDTIVDAEVVDRQTAATVEQLTPNDWVSWSGTGALAASAGTPLTGGSLMARCPAPDMRCISHCH